MESDASRSIQPSSVPPLQARGAILLWVAAAMLALLSLPLFALLDALQDDVSRLQVGIVEAQVSRVSPLSLEEITALRTTAATALTAEERLHEALLRASLGRVAWLAVLDRVIPVALSQVRLTSLEQHQDRLIIQGVAEGELALMAYVGRLRGSPLFEDVQVVSNLITPTPLPTPTASPTGTPGPNPSVTVTSSRADTHEVDDIEPKPIDLGMPQAHSFHPNFDVDRARFVGKASRRYRVFTSQLAAGVDTILVVTVGTATQTSDDRTTGDLSSHVEFTVPSHTDVVVNIMVTNRGRFGPDATYVLTAEEVGTGDSLEPDDANPRPIAAGEVQLRSFYPEGDIDAARLPVRGGRWYEVRTQSLAAGVDTALTVLVSGATQHNDDIAPGDRASRVVFQAAADGEAIITVRNKDRYGPAQTYELTAVELAAAPTATPGTSSGGGWVALSPRSQPRGVGLLAPAAAAPYGERQAPPGAGVQVVFVINLRLKGYQR